MLPSHRICGLLALMLTASLLSPAAADPPVLTCRLEAVRPLRAGGPVAIRLELTNRAAAPVWVLVWNTPFEDWRGTLLTVRTAGREVPYEGPLTKRGDPAAADYLEIPPGASRSATRDLALVYDLHRPGTYTVEVTASLQDVLRSGQPPRPRERFEPFPLACRILTLAVE